MLVLLTSKSTRLTRVFEKLRSIAHSGYNALGFMSSFYDFHLARNKVTSNLPLLDLRQVIVTEIPDPVSEILGFWIPQFLEKSLESPELLCEEQCLEQCLEICWILFEQP